MSETTNLKLFKHDNPTTNTNQFDVEKSLNNNFDKIDEFAGNINEKNKDQDKQIEANKNEISKIKDENTNVNKEFVDKSKIIENLLTELEDETIETEGNLTATNCAKAPAILEISGNYKQESREGKNKINPNKFIESRELNGIVYTKNDDGTFSVKGTATNNVTLSIIDLKDVIETGKTYCLYSNQKYDADLFNLAIIVKGDTTVWITSQNTVVTVNAENITSAYLTLYIPSGQTVDVQNIKVMLVETDSVDNDFESYGASPSIDYPSEIKSCGDNVNLYNYKDLNLSSDATVDDDGWITLEYNNTSGNNKRYANYFTNISNQIKTNTKYLLVVEIKKVSGNGEIRFTSGIDAQFPITGVENLSNLTNNSIKIYNVTSINSFSDITILLRTYLQLEPGQGGSITFRISLLEDTTITTETFIYTSYQEQNYTIPTQKPFRKIGEYADTFIKKDGRWYEKHFGDRYIFTGNENINKHNTVANNLYYINPSKNPIANKMYVPLNNNELVNIKCNCFKAQSVLDMVNANLSGIGLSMQKDIYIGTTLEGINTPEKLNEKLKELYDLGNPMYIDYPLKEPELIECTEEQIQILEELSKLETYYEVTNIISEDEIKPNFKLTYKLSNKLKQKELEERVSALESLLVNQENINQIESIEEQDVE